MSGFVKLPYHLIDSARLTQNELTVYMSLLRHRDHRTGRCWPSYATIAREGRVSRSTAIRVVKALEAQGIVKVVCAEPNRSNVYEVALFDATDFDSILGVGVTPGGIPVDQRDGSETPEGFQADTSAGIRVTREVDPPNSNHNVDQPNSTHGSALRSTGRPTVASFGSVTPLRPISPRQLTYIRDLYIQTTNGTPPQAQVAQWEGLDTLAADDLIRTYQRTVGRGGAYTGPSGADPAYNRLSAIGQDAADSRLVHRGRS